MSTAEDITFVLNALCIVYFKDDVTRVRAALHLSCRAVDSRAIDQAVGGQGRSTVAQYVRAWNGSLR